MLWVARLGRGARARKRLDRALDAFDQTQRVYVHCAANMRVSVFTAIYGTRRMGWSKARAAEHIAEVWEPDEIWRAFLSAQLV